jgi:hypothetical protein
MARTAVVAGTATAVSNRVSRNQAEKWAAQDQEQYEQQAQYAQPAPAPATDMGDVTAELEKLADLKEKGILTEEEFAAKKQQILGL